MRIESGNSDNVTVRGAGDFDVWFEGTQEIAIPERDTLPLVTMNAVSPRTGTLTLSGAWTCP